MVRLSGILINYNNKAWYRAARHQLGSRRPRLSFLSILHNRHPANQHRYPTIPKHRQAHLRTTIPFLLKKKSRASTSFSLEKTETESV